MKTVLQSPDKTAATTVTLTTYAVQNLPLDKALYHLHEPLGTQFAKPRGHSSAFKKKKKKKRKRKKVSMTRPALIKLIRKTRHSFSFSLPYKSFAVTQHKTTLIGIVQHLWNFLTFPGLYERFHL